MFPKSILTEQLSKMEVDLRVLWNEITSTLYTNITFYIYCFVLITNCICHLTVTGQAQFLNTEQELLISKCCLEF